MYLQTHNLYSQHKCVVLISYIKFIYFKYLLLINDLYSLAAYPIFLMDDRLDSIYIHTYVPITEYIFNFSIMYVSTYIHESASHFNINTYTLCSCDCYNHKNSLQFL